jgi:hypothetical protein
MVLPKFSELSRESQLIIILIIGICMMLILILPGARRDFLAAIKVLVHELSREGQLIIILIIGICMMLILILPDARRDFLAAIKVLVPLFQRTKNQPSLPGRSPQLGATPCREVSKTSQNAQDPNPPDAI